ncbi:MAG TPA: hypothetical protein VI669_13530 [Vicinamibacteria bacterium]
MDEPEVPTAEVMQRDQRALLKVTRHGLPTLAATERAVRRRFEDGRLNRRAVVRRRLLVATMALVALAFVPLRLPMLVGHEATLRIALRLAPEAEAEIARGFRASLGASGVAVDVGAGETVVRVRLEAASARVARVQADAFAGRLRRRGIEARVAVAPRRVATSARVYAYAANRVEQAWTWVRGRSAADVESDVRARLGAAGFDEATLYVHQEAGATRVEVRAVDPAGRVIETEHEERGGPQGARMLTPALPDFSDLEAMPLSERRTAIERRLKERGIEATVTLADGVLRIEARDQAERTLGRGANPKEEP